MNPNTLKIFNYAFISSSMKLKNFVLFLPWWYANDCLVVKEVISCNQKTFWIYKSLSFFRGLSIESRDLVLYWPLCYANDCSVVKGVITTTSTVNTIYTGVGIKRWWVWIPNWETLLFIDMGVMLRNVWLWRGV